VQPRHIRYFASTVHTLIIQSFARSTILPSVEIILYLPGATHKMIKLRLILVVLMVFAITVAVALPAIPLDPGNDNG